MLKGRLVMVMHDAFCFAGFQPYDKGMDAAVCLGSDGAGVLENAYLEWLDLGTVRLLLSCRLAQVRGVRVPPQVAPPIPRRVGGTGLVRAASSSPRCSHRRNTSMSRGWSALAPNTNSGEVGVVAITQCPQHRELRVQRAPLGW